MTPPTSLTCCAWTIRNYRYVMCYAGYTPRSSEGWPGGDRGYLLFSDDLVDWHEAEQNPVFGPETADDWDAVHVRPRSLNRIGDTWYLWYEGCNAWTPPGAAGTGAMVRFGGACPFNGPEKLVVLSPESSPSGPWNRHGAFRPHLDGLAPHGRQGRPGIRVLYRERPGRLEDDSDKAPGGLGRRRRRDDSDGLGGRPHLL